MAMRKLKDIDEYLAEATDRVAWMRKTWTLNKIAMGGDPAPPGVSYTQDEWRKLRLDALDTGFKSILSAGRVDPANPLAGRDYEYWEGIMAALRWVKGCDKDDLDT